MSALEFVSAFFTTPTYLFLFLNLIIGTIFLTSRLTSHHPCPAKPHPNPNPNPLTRAPSSLIDRVRSFNLSLYKFDAHPEADPVQHYFPGPDHGSPSPPPLARAPSLLDRLRSIDFYQRKFENVNPEPPQPHGVDPPAPPARAPSTLLDRLKSMNYYYQKFDQSADHPHEVDPSADAQGAAPLVRAPSLLQRVRSIKFPSFYDDPDHDDDDDGDDDGDDDDDDGNRRGKDKGHGGVRRIRSESERMGKTAREKEVEVGVEEINAKADDFIQRFRHQLRLQRVDSMMRYNKDMLTTGSGR